MIQSASPDIDDNMVIYILYNDAKESQQLIRLFEQDGFEPYSFTDTDKTLDAIRNRRPACLVVTANMAIVDCESLLDHSMKLQPKLPVIILSDSCAVPDAVKAVRAGCFDFLEKPIIERQLLARVHDAIQTF